MNALLEKEICRLWSLPETQDDEAGTWFAVGLSLLKTAFHAHALRQHDTAEYLMILSLIARQHSGVR
ncbi:MAG: hypothetical protein A2W25_01415 [candidate division Zixibacteria bacterium RBG_16_53_22]|nr:MAG: hypothetical protein A2W25_01415 [candidate division Zixibacteria bacterium RBG_16_53_22]